MGVLKYALLDDVDLSHSHSSRDILGLVVAFFDEKFSLAGSVGD